MESIGAPLLAAFAVMLVSLTGAVFASQALSQWTRSNLTYLATFSGGVFLMVVYHLLAETIHESTSIALAAGAVLFGATLLEALHHLLPAEHHHHNVEHAHAHTPVDGRRVLLSDALHNVGDGVLLVAAFATSWAIGLAATIGILIHELVQEISEFFVLREAGYSTSRALSRNFLTSSTILIGVALATFLSSADEIAVLFGGLAAGGFLAVLLRDLMPHAIESIKTRGGSGKHATALALGIVLMLGVQTYFGHEGGADQAHGGDITSSPGSRELLN
jgi:zinc and cadmium transporter